MVWYQVTDNLAQGDITKHRLVLELSVNEIFNKLSYEKANENSYSNLMIRLGAMKGF